MLAALQGLHDRALLPALLQLLKVKLNLVKRQRGHRLLVILQQHLRWLRGQQALRGERRRGQGSLSNGLWWVQEMGREVVL